MILIDMEMPKGCNFCHLQDVCESYQRDVVTEVVSIDTMTERYEKCPIKAEIPDNATNGDVIRLLFPDINMSEIRHDVWNGNNYDGLYIWNRADHCNAKWITLDWWNAPYKAESEVEE